MTRPTTYVHPLPELVWFFRDSAAEVGLRATPLEPHAHGAPHEVPGPSAAMLAAARRQSRVRETLIALSSAHQAALEMAYGRACQQPELVARFGQGAAVALAVGREQRNREACITGADRRAEQAQAADRIDAAVGVLRTAHEAYVLAARGRRDALRDERDDAKADGEARRVVLLDEKLGAKSTARMRAEAGLESIGFTADLRRAVRGAADELRKGKP